MGVRQLARRTTARLIRQTVHPVFPPLPPPLPNGFGLHALLLSNGNDRLAIGKHQNGLRSLPLSPVTTFFYNPL